MLLESENQCLFATQVHSTFVRGGPEGTAIVCWLRVGRDIWRMFSRAVGSQNVQLELKE
jgi:hypothetical protein